MKNIILIAGFGGQGVMLSGQLLGYAMNEANKEALFLPQYGPEQRGGTANCTVILATEEVGSPIAEKVDVLIAMNSPSLIKFKNSVKAGGTIFFNSSDKAEASAGNENIEIYNIPVDTMSEKLGSRKVANIIMLGAYLEKAKILTKEEMLVAINKRLAKKPAMLEINKAALQKGIDFINNRMSEDRKEHYHEIQGF